MPQVKEAVPGNASFLVLLNMAQKLSCQRQLTPLPLPSPSMDDNQPNPTPEFTHSSTRESESSSHASGMFSHSQQFTVKGRIFTNITNNYTSPSVPSDFRMIPMGDIDLRHEIRVSNSTVLVDRHGQAHVSRRQRRTGMAERSCKIYVYAIIQICGAANSNGIHTTLFNDDLIPLREVLDRSRDSHFLTVYIRELAVATGSHLVADQACGHRWLWLIR
ncbi:hypothetical protein MSAN_00122900 [Mycena sanguinolenta]|uniref:Uncharacterized protein n=1 Tax=Mycena sanguinolenta TaxID=230812 RepID=A0A8H6ZDN6_9AGAR|nr:hypothetical protein MSAN_00122900 [Mycena sanguinolenta]